MTTIFQSYSNAHFNGRIPTRDTRTAIGGPEKVEYLDEARLALSAALSDWIAAWEIVGKALRHPGVESGHSRWVGEAGLLALARHRQAGRSLEEAWPVPSVKDELRRAWRR